MIFEQHEIADIFPRMEKSSEEFAELVNDIKKNGLLQPVWIYEGKILDGRNRYAACICANVHADLSYYEGDDPVGFVLSLNLHRRHLTAGQKGMIASNIAGLKWGGDRKSQTRNSYLDTSRPVNSTTSNGNDSNSAAFINPEITISQSEGKIAIESNGLDKEVNVKSGDRNSDLTHSSPVKPAITISQAAKLIGTSVDSVNSAAKLKREAVPELVEKVKSGEVSLNAALKISKLPIDEQRVIVEKGVVAIKEAMVEEYSYMDELENLIISKDNIIDYLNAEIDTLKSILKSDDQVQNAIDRIKVCEEHERAIIMTNNGLQFKVNTLIEANRKLEYRCKKLQKELDIFKKKV